MSQTVLNPSLTPSPIPLSRSSSRASIRSRAASPSISSLDDTVAVRNQMSTLKHNIRHQQAQLHSLENVILRGARPYPPVFSPPHSPEIPDTIPYRQNGGVSEKIQRRSSFDVLHGLAGPESSLPLPRRDQPPLTDSGIREGIPSHFSTSGQNPTHHKRVSSPTRTLSRIPVSSVGNARALADEGLQSTPLRSPLPSSVQSSHGASNSISNSSMSNGRPQTTLDINGISPSTPQNGQTNGDALLGLSSSSLQPPSPSKRLSLTPGGTTRVLADLQTGVINARAALENTKAQLRLSQRSVAQLTRQTEDLKEGRERLRLENEGLNNVVARKERLLQEVLERARKAEAEASQLKTQLKSETSSAKKSLREMETALTESTALSQKSEREYITLRESIKGMVESWKRDTDRIRDEMKIREEAWRKEAASAGTKYKKLTEEIQEHEKLKKDVQDLRMEEQKRREEVEEVFRKEISELRGQVANSNKESDEAVKTSERLAEELSRLRRLMRTHGRSPDQTTFADVGEADLAQP